MTDHEHEDDNYVTEESLLNAIGFSVTDTDEMTEAEHFELGPFPFIVMVPVILEDGKYALTFRAHGFSSKLQAAKMAHTFIDAVGRTAAHEERHKIIESANDLGVDPAEVVALREKFDTLVEDFNIVLEDDRPTCGCTEPNPVMVYDGPRDDFTCPVCSHVLHAEDWLKGGDSGNAE